MTRDTTIDRYAVEQLPVRVEPLVEWLRGMLDTLAEDVSEWLEDQRRRLWPGSRMLLDVAEGELDEARTNLEWLRELLTTDTGERFRRDPDRPGLKYRHVVEVKQSQEAARCDVRRTLRAYLRQVVDVARTLEATDDELPELLADARPRTSRT